MLIHCPGVHELLSGNLSVHSVEKVWKDDDEPSLRQTQVPMGATK